MDHERRGVRLGVAVGKLLTRRKDMERNSVQRPLVAGTPPSPRDPSLASQLEQFNVWPLGARPRRIDHDTHG